MSEKAMENLILGGSIQTTQSIIKNDDFPSCIYSPSECLIVTN